MSGRPSTSRPHLSRADSGLLSPPDSHADAHRVKPFDELDVHLASATASECSSSFLEIEDGHMTVDDPFASPTTGAAVREERKRREKVPGSSKRKEKSKKKPLPDGWNDPENPFVAKEGEVGVRRPVQKPEKVAYVFRGKRITYDIPFDALTAPDDPTDSPFPDPSPRLLFPAPPVTPPKSTSAPSFLQRLQDSKREMQSPEKAKVEFGLPTPAKEKDARKGESTSRKDARDERKFEPYRRKMAGIAE